MVKILALVPLAAALLMPFKIARAAPTPAGAVAPAKAPTLAGALRTAAAPARGVALAVGADTVTLAAGQQAPPEGAGLADIIAAFGRQAQDFGAVTALAPLTATLLNENPPPPDVTADLNAMTAFKVLAASLTDSQWQALTSERGLGLSDLTDDRQQRLFHALFRRGHLWVASEDPALAGLPDAQRTDARDVSDQADGVRVRLGQTADFYPHDHAGKTIYFSAGAPDAARRLHTWSPKQDRPAALHNVALRATVPNILKTGDLDFDGAALQVSVPLAGLRTVDDLVARIASLTRLELYADPHYGRRTVTVLGTDPAAPVAADLLRALALDVAGTYRRVGPAYVLTDDLSGVGARRKRLQEWEEIARSGNEQLDNQAGQEMLKRHAAEARTLPAFGDSLALTSDQMAALEGDPSMPGIPMSRPSPVPFSKLSPAQQAAVRRSAEVYTGLREKDTLPTYLKADGFKDPDLAGSVDLMPQTKVQFLIPTVDGSVDTDLEDPMFMLFWPGMAAVEANLAAKPPAGPVPKVPAPPPLASVLRSRPRRAVIGHPRTAQDVDALVAAMRRVGLNEMWLDVFSQGESHLSGADGTPDILTEALAKTKGTGIAVYADLRLLAWGDAPPEAARDLTVEGQTSREAATDAHDRQPEPDFDDAGKPVAFVPPPVAVSPLTPTVRDGLASLVGTLADRPGLAGFVWEDAGTDDALGYTPAMRLAFLRARHADPLDITPKGLYLRADVSLPGFDDPALDKAMPGLWAKARTDAALGLLTRMRQAITPPLPVLMEQNAVRTAWLTSWDDPRQLPPPLRPLFADWPYPAPEKLLAVARTQGRAVLLREAVPDTANVESLSRSLDTDLRSGQQAAAPQARWDGFVLDFADRDATRGDKPLSTLPTAALTPPPTRPAPQAALRP